MFKDFYEAWNFLEHHSIFNNKNGSNCFKFKCLDIHVAKVNPETCEIDDDNSKNTKVEIWLESGEYLEEYNIGRHDIDLDCGGNTFEEAIIKLANLVHKKFGDK